jgi:hypothetical protein
MVTIDKEAPDMNPSRRVDDGAHAPSTHAKPRPRVVLATVIAATAALAIAGCGGSAPSTTATGGNNSTSSVAAGGDTSAGAAPNSHRIETDAVKFARCMRAHGISNFADPTNGGELTIPPGDENSPAFTRASQACQPLLAGIAGGVGPSGQRSDLSRAQGIELAKCMRAHGVPNFPDPTVSGGIPPGSVNPNRPAVKAALAVCQPAGAPSQAP